MMNLKIILLKKYDLRQNHFFQFAANSLPTMFALAGRKMILVTEAMSKGNSEDCRPFVRLISQFADFHELRQEKALHLSDIVEEHSCDYEDAKEPTKFEYNGHTIFIIKVNQNLGGYDDGGFEHDSKLRWECEEYILHYRIPSMPLGEVGYMNGGEDLAEALMVRLEGNHFCELCGYLVGCCIEDLCRNCVCSEGVACKTCGLTCGKRRLEGEEHRECKRRRTGE